MRESENMVRDTKTRLERAAGELDDLLVRVTPSTTLSMIPLIGYRGYQKSAKRNAELERDPELRDAEVVLAAVNSA